MPGMSRTHGAPRMACGSRRAGDDLREEERPAYVTNAVSQIVIILTTPVESTSRLIFTCQTGCWTARNIQTYHAGRSQDVEMGVRQHTGKFETSSLNGLCMHN
ncbi:hypothetical protein QJS10_CPB18g01353 [Acorus calamus]|uniref:Uncharacterized protein n=1 Tax=Acorus calamus TaxID=4465 RepID=A0AAV9CS44_ACOCL|nr:hypothetical protein QJS10_CPB18g01353 [Acorus calamus]